MTRKYLDLGGNFTYHTSRSQFIMSQALPQLRQEFLAGPERERPDDLGRDLHEPGVPAVAPVGAPEGERVTATTSTLPGVRRVEHMMGMPIIVDVRDDGFVGG